MSLVVRKPVFGVSDRSDTNQAVQSQKMARGLKFRIKGLYYPYSGNKGADQLRSYCAADLRLCFRICKKPVISQRGSYFDLFSRNRAIAFSGPSNSYVSSLKVPKIKPLQAFTRAALKKKSNCPFLKLQFFEYQ